MSVAIDRVLEVLADDEWHPREDIVTKVMPMMAPGQAYRRAEQRRVAAYGRRGTSVQTRQPSDRDRAVASGQRKAVLDLLRGLRSRGRIEVDGDVIRLAPKET